VPDQCCKGKRTSESLLSEIVSRIARLRTAKLLGRSTIANIATFLFDLALLWAFVERLGVPYIPAAAGAFLLAISINYGVSRLWVFPHSDRGMALGFAYFLITAGIGLLVTMAVFVLLLEVAGLFYIAARIIASAVAGLIVFALNAGWNFKAV
jgi:putative flippase GtrA